MWNKLKKPIILSLIIFVITVLGLTSMTYALNDRSDYDPNIVDNQSKYKKPAINDLVGLGANPYELLSYSNADAADKEWYEYISYSKDPVGYLSVTGHSDQRLVFYDPYDYQDSIIMEVNNDVSAEQSGFTTANSISVSYTKSKTISTSTSTSRTEEYAIQIAENDIYKTTSSEVSTSQSNETTSGFSTGLSSTLSSSTKASLETSTAVSAETSVSAGIPTAMATASVGTEASVTAAVETEFSASVTGSLTTALSNSNGFEQAITTSGEYTVNQIGDRITTATGVANIYTKDFTTSESVTITTTYDAAYFQETGNPFSWKVMSYTVKMPLLCNLEYKIDGEWVVVDSQYVVITTLHGTCRCWIENSTTYYEHWGTGEKVTYNDFWNQFFTEESLKQAYQNKLYPDN